MGKRANQMWREYTKGFCFNRIPFCIRVTNPLTNVGYLGPSPGQYSGHWCSMTGSLWSSARWGNTAHTRPLQPVRACSAIQAEVWAQETQGEGLVLNNIWFDLFCKWNLMCRLLKKRTLHIPWGQVLTRSKMLSSLCHLAPSCLFAVESCI